MPGWSTKKQNSLSAHRSKRENPRDYVSHNQPFAFLEDGANVLMFHSSMIGIASGIMFLIFAISFPIFLLTDLDDHTAIKIITAFSSLVSGCLTILLCLFAIVDNTIEEKIEQELIFGLKKSKD